MIEAIIVGILAGFIASKLTGGEGKGCWIDLFLGLLGGVVGKWLLGLLGITGTQLAEQHRYRRYRRCRRALDLEQDKEVSDIFQHSYFTDKFSLYATYALPAICGM